MNYFSSLFWIGLFYLSLLVMILAKLVIRKFLYKSLSKNEIISSIILSSVFLSYVSFLVIFQSDRNILNKFTNSVFYPLIITFFSLNILIYHRTLIRIIFSLYFIFYYIIVSLNLIKSFLSFFDLIYFSIFLILVLFELFSLSNEFKLKNRKLDSWNKSISLIIFLFILLIHRVYDSYVNLFGSVFIIYIFYIAEVIIELFVVRNYMLMFHKQQSKNRILKKDILHSHLKNINLMNHISNLKIHLKEMITHSNNFLNLFSEMKDYLTDSTNESLISTTNTISQDLAIQNLAFRSESLNGIVHTLDTSIKNLENKGLNIKNDSAKVASSSRMIDESMIKIYDSFKNLKASASAISEISTKTNLLSLNASIEAARAGEFGNGFAVVSEEIIKLAKYSKEKTSQIYTIINNSNVILTEVSEAVEKTIDLTIYQDREMEQFSTILNNFVELKNSILEVSSHLSNEIIEMSELSTQLANSSRANLEMSGKISNTMEMINVIEENLKKEINFLMKVSSTPL